MQFSDLATAGFYADPYPLYQKLRDAGPILPLAPGFWVTGRHGITDALLRDRRFGRNFVNSTRARYGEVRAQAPVFRAYGQMILTLNPPDHTRLRTLLMKAFSAKQVAGLHGFIQDIANGLIDAFIDAGSVDLMKEYALRLPIMVICTLLGLPHEDADKLAHAMDTFAQVFEAAPMSDAQIDAANQGIAFMQAYFAEVLQSRRQHPGDDLVSLLLHAKEGEDRLTEDEIISNLIFLFLAGHETTGNMIGNALVALHRHPAQLALAMSDHTLLPNVIRECMRYDGSVQMTMRAALEDLEIEGVGITRGEVIVVFLGAACRDPARFSNPDSLLINRPDQDMRVLGFGGGIHHCLGARLALDEMEIALSTLFRRLPAMRLTGLDALTYSPRNSLRGLQSLHTAW